MSYTTPAPTNTVAHDALVSAIVALSATVWKRIKSGSQQGPTAQAPPAFAHNHLIVAVKP